MKAILIFKELQLREVGSNFVCGSAKHWLSIQVVEDDVRRLLSVEISKDVYDIGVMLSTEFQVETFGTSTSKEYLEITERY